MTMQNKDSSWVYVVSLSPNYVGYDNPDYLPPGSTTLTYREVVNLKNCYFYPIKAYWPKDVPNYLGFRYDGCLQSIHHVESFVVTDNLHTEIAELPDYKESDKYYVCKLGPAIRPPKRIPNGDGIIMAARRWAMIDTLLTADTISEAFEISKNRQFYID